MPASEVAHGTPEMLREAIAEQLWLVGCNCENAIRYVELGDDAGLAYSVRRIVACTHAIVATTADLVEQVPQPEARPAKVWTEDPS
jgi:hypothetical protein